MKGRYWRSYLARFAAFLVFSGALSVAAEVESGPRIQATAVSFPEGDSVTVFMGGTARLMGASGKAKITRKLGFTEIELDLDGMKPAVSFGGDFNTFVLWSVSPEGITFNTGECILRGVKSELRVTTPLMNFALFVTAEPHFLVQQPSDLFVMMNTDDGLAGRKNVSTTRFEYTHVKTGYTYKRENLLTAPATEGRLRTDRYQALLAVTLARQANANRYAPEEFRQAQEALDETQRLFAQGLEEKVVATAAHRAVNAAVVAKRLAEERAAQEALETERRNSSGEIARLSLAKEQAETAAARAREESERAREAARKVEAALRQMEERLQQANLQADQLARQKLQADRQAESARQQAAAMYVRLQDALSRVADTRETERGLVVNLPDILFDSGKATLRPRAREILGRIAGILLVIPEYRLSIEGHTDSVGRSAANQKLSEERAANVRGYLAEAQLSPALMTTRGFGESQPVESNMTEAGRQKNRRVELIIEGLTRAGR